MASQLTPREVAHIADLARLTLSTDERQMFSRQLTDILAYANTIQQVDTAAIDRSHATDTSPGDAAPPALRADEPVAGLNRDEVLAEAPDGVRDAGLFRVPKVI
jgi:aspartyl-tRNA(Asn)/glutamyl-tRNA(Gln) amidotransferase subunit C